MDRKEVEKTVDKILKEYPDILTRTELKKLLGVSYHQVPKEVKRLNIPVLGLSGKFERIRIHKSIYREYLIEEYLK